MADRKKKKETNFAITAFRVVQEATKEAEQMEVGISIDNADISLKNLNAVALGRLDGL